VGVDGKEKMSQSLGNFIGVRDEPNDMFGKTMSIPDDIIENYFELATDVPMDEVRAMLEPGKNPRDAKVRLAKEIVRQYHGDEAAEAAERYFVETFSQRKQPVDAEEVAIPAETIDEGLVNLPAMLVALGLAKSNGNAKDLMKAGAVSVDGEKLQDARVKPEALVGKTLKVGKHQFRKLTD
jgi:tyrosyl-tRNA synthetase